MIAHLTKVDMPDLLRTDRTLIRLTTPDDSHQIAIWPGYEWQWHWFNMIGSHAPVSSKNGLRWWEQIDEANRCHYSVIVPDSGQVIGIHAFVRIDWAERRIGNMGCRMHPAYCSQGYGSEALTALFKAILDRGMQSIRLDVAASNERAIHCYQKCGMEIVGECWREHKGELDVTDPRYAFVLPHLRRVEEKLMVRFHWMETANRLLGEAK